MLSYWVLLYKWASSHGLELVSVISSVLNRCTDRAGAVPTAQALAALAYLWRGAAVAPPSTWRALEPKLGRDNRPAVLVSICKLLAEVPGLRVSVPEYDKLVSDASRKLWSYVAESNHPEVVEAACDALAGYKLEDYTLKDIPEVYRRTVKLPAAFCKTPADAARKPEDVLDYVPCEIWPQVFQYTNQAALEGVQRLASRLIEREIRGYRSGVYQPDARGEPQGVDYLPPHSVVRGLMGFFKRQAATPSYDCPDSVLLSILETLTEEYPKPLPPIDLCFLHELFHRGSLWKSGSIKLAARQAQTSGSARRFLDNYLQSVQPGVSEESDIMLVFELLPILCRGMPPNSLRPPLERCFGDAFSAISQTRAKNWQGPAEELLFVRQLEMIRHCLECEKIHDANRTLLSQMVENYFSVLNDDNVAWPAYVQTCRPLSTKYLERMTSPSGWWEVTGELLRKSCAVRCAVAEAAVAAECDAPLVWLNEMIDAHATLPTEQQSSMSCMLPALMAAKADDRATRDWFLQLMARIQVAFTECDDDSAKLYFCDVFMLSAIVFSGHWSLEPDSQELMVASRSWKQSLLPAAVVTLLKRDAWTDSISQMLEWLCHTRDVTKDGNTALCCQRALLALRHSSQFSRGVWTRLERYFGQDTANED